VSLRAVLLDATGVLIEVARPVGETYAALADRHGVTIPAWRLDDAFRRVLRHAPARPLPGQRGAEAAAGERAWWRERVRQTFQAADSTARFADFDRFFGALYAHFGEGRAWRVCPGAVGALDAMRGRGWATGVVSNFDHRLPSILQDLGIAPLLDVVTLPSTCGHAKPDPAIFEAALGVLGVAPDEAVFVGHDPDVDLAGARAAGLRAVGIAPGTDLADLPARIEQVANLGA
jgi:putative hydrolase of the HAD superfamily